MREETKYLVGITGDTATMAVIGKANYLNCRNVGEFFSTAIERGCRKIVVDCSQCNGMDSTFLGMVAGAALKIHKTGGEMVLLNLNDRNMELIDNLGIYKLVNVEEDKSAMPKPSAEFLPANNATHANILNAHENLVEADSSNKTKFEDVITFLKKETQSK